MLKICIIQNDRLVLRRIRICMARCKAYNEEDVIEKATELFWRKGYEATSMRELEEVMGINKFSIYSSFGSKQGVFLECIRYYKRKIQPLVDKLKASNKGVEAIKEFFYDFLVFSKAESIWKGCLLTSTATELGADGEEIIMAEIYSFSKMLKSIFADKLRADGSTDEELIARQANFLLVAKQGLSNAEKVFDHQVLVDFIETTFEIV